MSKNRVPLRYVFAGFAVIVLLAFSAIAENSWNGGFFGSIREFLGAASVNAASISDDAVAVSNGPIVFQRGFYSPSDKATAFIINPASGTDTPLNQPDVYGRTTDSRGELAFSPDGSQIAYSSGGVLSLMNADGSNARPVGYASGVTVRGRYPAWSPDGTKLVFIGGKDASDTDANDFRVVWTVNVDGSGRLKLTNYSQSLIYESPSWGNGKIAFGCMESYPNYNICTINPDGTGKTAITNSGSDHNPKWSRDGSLIVFDSGRGGSGSFPPTKIYTMNGQGANVRAITTGIPNDAEPAWSPDGLRIVFSSVPDGTYSSPRDLYVINADGTGKTKLNTSSPGGSAADWGTATAAPPTPTPTPTPAPFRLNFEGRLRDKVSKSKPGLRTDGELDGTFSIKLASGQPNKTVTKLDLAGPSGNRWDTDPNNTALWIVGAGGTLDSSLLNQGNGSVNFASGLGDGTTTNFFIFIPDSNPTSFLTGKSFTLTITYSDGTTSSASTTITQTSAVDLGLTLTGPGSNVATNQEFRYQLRATNYGTQPATNVKFVDTLPPGLAFVRNQFGNCTAAGSVSSGQTVTCTLDFALPPATYANVLLYVKSSQGLTFTNSATVTANEPEPSPDTNPNSATAQTNVQTATDLSVTMDAPNSTANGAEIAYQIRVKNLTTDADAGDVTLTDTLPDGVTNVSMTGPTTSSVRCDPFGNGKIVCHLDAVERNITYTFLLKLLPPRTGQIVNKANVTSNTNPDPNLLNNDATQTTVARTVSDIAVTMDGPTQVQQGENATYTMTVKNIGTATAQDVRFLDGWSDNADLVSFSPSPGTSIPNCSQNKDDRNVPSNSITCLLGQIGPGFQLTVRVTVHPRVSGNVSNQGFAFPFSSNDDVGDADNTNNSATRSTLACVAGSGAAPVFQKSGNGVATAGQLYSYQANATDSRGGRVTYSLAQSPAGMTIDANSGLVKWTPDSSFVNRSVTVSITASNGTCNGTSTQTFSLAVGDAPAGGYLLQLGSVQVTSMTAVKTSGAKPTHLNPKSKKPQILIEDGTYKLGGDTKVNEFLSVEGDITIVVNKAADRIDFTINGGKGYLTNIPFIGTKVLWEGGITKFTLNGQGVLSAIDQTGQFIQKLEAAKVGIGITNAQLLFAERGIRISGNVKLPAVPGIPGLTGTLQGLEISRQNGLVFQGQIVLPDFDLGGFSIKNVTLDFQPDPGHNKDKDVFTGKGSIVVPNTVTVVGSVKLVGGSIDSVMASVELQGAGIPLIPPFLTLVGGTVEVSGLRTGQFSLYIAGDFTITDARLSNVIKLSKAGLRYTAPGSLSGSSDLEIFTFKVAQAGLGLVGIPNQKEVSFDVDVTLIDNLPILLVGAGVKTGYSVTDTGAKYYFNGNAHGSLQIPDGKGLGYDLVKTFVGKLPHTVAGITVQVGFPPAQFSTSTSFPVIGDFHVAVRNVQVAAQNQIQVLVGRNLSELQKAAAPDLPPDYKTEAYQKKMLKAMRPDADKVNDPLAQHSLYVPVLTPSSPQSIGTVTVPANQPKAFFRLLGGQSAPLYDIISPTGVTITPDNAALHNATFAQDADSNQSFYVVANPESGIWSVEAETGGSGPFVLDSVSTNAAPLMRDVQIAPQGGGYQINYNAIDMDSPDAHVSLYYSSDSTGAKGTLIKDGLVQSASGTVTWNAANGSVPTGDYYVYAVIDDDVNLPVQKFAPTKVHVVDSLAPAAPQSVTVVPGGANDLVVSWAPNTESNLKGYQVRYIIDKGDGAPLTQSIDAGNTMSIRLMNLANATQYRVAVAAYNSRQIPDPNNPGQTTTESRTGDQSTILTATTGIGMPPVVQITSPNGGEAVPADGDVTISWQVDRSSDLLTQLVELSTDGGMNWYPLQSNLDGTVRNVRWHVPTGTKTSNALVRVTTTDRAGNTGSDVSDAAFSFVPALGTPLTVGGRVVTPDGRGLRNATVSMTDSQGVVQTATTSSFGFFSFSTVPAGETYTLRIQSRLYRFATRTVQINDNITLPDFVGLE